MFVDENNRELGNLGKIPGGNKTYMQGEGLQRANAMNLAAGELRRAQSQRAECGNQLMASNNMPPPFAISGADKVAFYETRIPYLLRCLRGDLSPTCQQTRANQGDCLEYTIFRMFKAYGAAKRLRDSEAAAQARNRQADADLLGRAIAASAQQGRDQRAERSRRAALQRMASVRAGFTSGSKISKVASMDALSRFRRGASKGSLLNAGGSSALNKGFTTFELTPPQNESDQPRSRGQDNSFDPGLYNMARGVQPNQNRRDFGLMSRPEDEAGGEAPGMSMAIDCSGISTDPNTVASLISQCRISLEGENAGYTLSLPPQEQPCNVLLSCGGGRIPPSADVMNAIMACGEDQGYNSLACDRLEILLNAEYPAVGDPNMSLPYDEPNMSLPDDEGDYYPDGPMSLPPEDGGTITVPGPGNRPGEPLPVKEEEEDKTMLYVGIGAAVLIAAYLVTQKRK